MLRHNHLLHRSKLILMTLEVVVGATLADCSNFWTELSGDLCYSTVATCNYVDIHTFGFVIFICDRRGKLLWVAAIP